LTELHAQEFLATWRLQSKAYTMDKSGIIFVIVLASVIEVTGRTYFSSLNLRALKALCFC